MDRNLWSTLVVLLSLFAVCVDGQALGDTCFSTPEMCDVIPNAQCDTVSTFSCVCLLGYSDDGSTTNCIANVLGDPCATSLACAAIPDATCDTVSTATCVCATGYKDDGTGEACVPKEIGDQCFVTPQCSAIANSICEANLCACDAGYAANGGVCEQILCDALDPPTDGAVDTSGGFTVGAVAIFSCAIGYDPDSPVNVNCLDDGTWDTSTHTCTIKECPALTQPTSGTAVLDSGDSGPATYLDTATYACNAGYSPDDPVTSTCGADGVWDITVYTCTIKSCGSLGNPANGGVDSSAGTTYGSVAIFSCDPGYEPIGTVDSACQADGTWDVLTHTCTPRSCPDPSPTNGQASGTFVFPNAAAISCNTGYENSGSDTITCTDTGDWNETPTCDPKDCGDPSPLHGSASGTNTYPNTVAISCDPGYDRVGTSPIQCTAAGTWSSSPTCEAVDCGDPSPTNGFYTGLTTYPESGSIDCNDGYDRSGSATVTCQTTGSWDSSPVCNPVSCGDPSPANGAASGTFLYPTSSSITCDSGYIRVGVASINCLDTASWSSSPTCDPVDCGSPAPVDGSASGPTTFPGSSTISCDTGYERSGPETVTCEDNGFWDASAVCNPVECGTPDILNGGSNAPGGTTYMQEATLICNSGYELFGTSPIICQATGIWSGTFGCDPVVCPSLDNPTNGLVSAPVPTYQEEASYTCNTGYNVAGDQTRTCQADQTWSGNEPTCEIQTCAGLTAPANGLIDGYTTQGEYQDTATYSCNTGYTRNGAETTICLDDGSWSLDPPTCDIVDCFSLSDPLDGVVTTTMGTTYNELAEYTCNLGFVQDGVTSRTCQASGSWDGVEPTCTLADCGTLPAPIDGSVNTDGGIKYDAEAQYSCITGYQLIGVEIRVCQEDETWSFAAPTCVIRDCDTLPTPSGGSVDHTAGTEYQGVAIYSCDLGYAPDDNVISTCQEDGTWDVLFHVCTIKDCGGLVPPIDGEVELADGVTTYDSTAIFSCNTGYSPDDPVTATCLAAGTWDVSTHACTIKDCGSLPNPANGAVDTPGGTEYLAEADYSCIVGYDLVGTSPRICRSAGVWSDTAPVCNIVNCPSLVVPDHGTLDSTTGVYEDVVQYDCDIGYDILGVDSRTCQADAQWTDDDPICDPRDCGILVDPPDGFAKTPDGTTYSQVGVYTCITGYEPLGDTTVTCQADRSWTIADPDCTIKDCLVPDTPTNGRVDYTKGTKYQDEATYNCLTGYDLVGDVTTTCQDDGTWSVYQTTYCLLKDCMNLDNPENGIAETPDGTTYLQQGIYTCNSGYIRLGQDTTTCQSDGTWSVVDPLCTIKNCGLPSSPANGGVDTSNGMTYTSTATYFCDPGYDLAGDQSTVCLSDSSWSVVSTPFCLIRSCGNLPDPTDGAAATPDGTDFGDVGDYTCDTGYDLMGVYTSQCQDDGTWRDGDPLCTIKDCGVPDAPDNGMVDYSSGMKYTDRADFSCNAGYDITGDSFTTCQSDATWTISTPTRCIVRSCAPPPKPLHGDADSSQGTDFGDSATFSCNTGYTLSGAFYTECLDTGLWDGQTAVCTVISCGDLDNPANGELTLDDGTTYLALARYSCNTGYSMEGVQTRTCEADTMWSGTSPVCTIKSCGSLNAPIGGEMTLSEGIVFGSSATFSCSTGFDLSHGNTLHCLSNAQWSGSEPTCVIRNCGGLNAPTDGSVFIPDGTDYGAVATYSCFDGHNLIGLASRECLSTAQWSGSSSPSCQIKDCQTLFPPAHGTIDLTEGTLYGATATFRCEEGYTLLGELTRQCLDSATWSTSTPTCQIVDCKVLASPGNGLVTMDQGTTYGEVAVFECNDGYRLSGYTSRTCQSDGTWSNSNPTCNVQSCAMLTYPNGGTVDISTGISFGEVATYDCNLGYYLIGTKSIVCMADTSWSDDPPTCQIKDCSDPPVVNDGYVMLPSGTEYQDIATYSCDTNYGLVGNRDITCEDTGMWSVEPVCLPDCSSPALISNGFYELDGDTLAGTIATYTCHNGYRISGNSQVVCQSNGEWANLPECVVEETPYGDECYIDEQCVTPSGRCRDDGSGTKLCLCYSGTNNYYDSAVDTCLYDCGPLSDITNGVVDSPDITAEGQIAKYSCHVGFALTGDETRTCESTGWSGSVPSCGVGCLVPVPPSFGYVNASKGTAAGSTVSYLCQEGYSLVGDSTRFCLSDTTWNGVEPICVIECPVLEAIAHASVDMSQGNWEGSKATFICDGDYALIGVPTRTCLDTGKWSGAYPECIYAVFWELLIVFGVLFAFLLLVDCCLIVLWIYLKKFRDKKEKDNDDNDDVEDKYQEGMEETPRQQGPARMSFKKNRNSRVGPDYKQSAKAPQLLPPIPRKPLNLRADGTPYQTRAPKPKPIQRGRPGYGGFRDETVPFVPLVTSRTPPVMFQQQPLTDLEPEPTQQKPDGYVTSTSEDSQHQKAPSVAEEDQASIDQQANNSGVEADEHKEPPKVMQNSTTGFEGRMGLPKGKNQPGEIDNLTGDIKKSLKNSVNAYMPNARRTDPISLKPSDKEGVWYT